MDPNRPIALMYSSILVGPPLKTKPVAAPPPPAPAVPDPFMDLMVSNFNKAAAAPPPPPMGLTENGSATYLASGNPCIDFFFHVVPDSPAASIEERLRAAWSHDALTTLKLICNLRGVRGTGKSDKEGFFTAALWLHRLHPKTLASNVGPIADFGCFKDLPEILYRLLEGSEIRETQRQEWSVRKLGKPRTGGGEKKKKKKSPSSVAREIRISNALERNRSEKERASAVRNEKKNAMAEKLLARYGGDPDFKLLYNKISDHFADCLRSDLENLRSGKTREISLAAKWCPSLDLSFDRSTLLCESIARRIFTRESFPEYNDLEEAHYAYRIRDRLRKEVLVPLRKHLELPEVYIGQNAWNLIPYNRVASVAMELYKERFMEHDGERFEQYLEDVKSGKAMIAAGALLPHQIIASLGDSDSGQVAELQWKRTVDDMLKLGKLRNSIAVCDVSGSMYGKPMEVCVALGLLLSELSDDPWKGKVITFSETPQLHLIPGSDLASKYQFVSSMEWGYNTDFQKVFDLILDVAVAGKLSPSDMIKRVFVFSDMEFDQASSWRAWETDYERICRRFEEKGYGSSVPEIVFWNLRESRSTPVMASQKGVAMVSGFSKNLMKMFLTNDGTIDPVTVMEAAISGKEYEKLAVVD